MKKTLLSTQEEYREQAGLDEYWSIVQYGGYACLDLVQLMGTDELCLH
jgi:hypothetical protein